MCLWCSDDQRMPSSLKCMCNIYSCFWCSSANLSDSCFSGCLLWKGLASLNTWYLTIWLIKLKFVHLKFNALSSVAEVFPEAIAIFYFILISFVKPEALIDWLGVVSYGSVFTWHSQLQSSVCPTRHIACQRFPSLLWHFVWRLHLPP